MNHYVAAVERALAFIEANLRAPVTLDAIARRAGFSLWHFQRIFAAHTGEPLAFYLRRRRLTAAAQELRESRRPVLDVALDYQFESHAAFTRAFAQVLGLNPSVARRQERLPRFAARALPSRNDLHHLSRQLAVKPQIIRLPALRLAGLTARFIGPMSPDCNNHEVIPPLFGRFGARRATLPPPLDGFTYGVTQCADERDRKRDDELVYLAAIRVDAKAKLPKGFEAWKLPARTYALFLHQGPVTQIGETFNYIYGTWLPRSRRKLASELSIERYDERFGDGGKDSQLEILIPLQGR